MRGCWGGRGERERQDQITSGGGKWKCDMCTLVPAPAPLKPSSLACKSTIGL